MPIKAVVILISTVFLASTLGAQQSATPEAGENRSVPRSWDGIYAMESSPAKKSIAIHDGKIFTIFGQSETELFPGKLSDTGNYTCSEDECSARETHNMKIRFIRDPKTNKILYISQWGSIIYTKMR